MNLVFSDHAWDDYLYWRKADRKTLKRVNLLIQEIMRDLFSGIGKPETLRHGLSGYWSRRTTDEHRIVYKSMEDTIFIAQLRYHY